MESHVFTMTTNLSEPAVFGEANSELPNIIEENTGIFISTDMLYHDEEYENREIIYILSNPKSAPSTLSGRKRNVNQVERVSLPKDPKSPKSIKHCNVCNNMFLIPVPQKSVNATF